jgi:hypothetical protein
MVTQLKEMMTMPRHLPVAAVTLAVTIVSAACTSGSTPAARPTTTPTPAGTTAPPSPPPPSAPAPTRPATASPRGPTPARSPLATRPVAGQPHATSLHSQTKCGPPGSLIAIADLTWRPAAASGTQRVVFTPYADGYRTGRYDLTSDLGPDATRTSLTQLSPGSVYTWLVLTRHDGTWQPSASASFTVPTCVGDQTGG